MAADTLSEADRLGAALGLLNQIASIATNSRGEPDGKLRKIAQTIEFALPRLGAAESGQLVTAATPATEEDPDVKDCLVAIYTELRGIRRCLRRATRPSAASPTPAGSATS